MEPMKLSFIALLDYLNRAIMGMKDPKLNCKCCSSRTHKNGTVTYFHSAILPVIVAPRQAQVISLAPEFIT
jgi:hypothetical protein